MDIKSLKETYKNYFEVGAAVHTGTINTHADLLLRHFSSVTCENDMKFAPIHPEKDRYNFTNADKIVDFAVNNNIKVRGHTLVWHNQTPGWVFKGKNGEKAAKEELVETMTEHINEVMNRYKGKVYCYDVVNEAVDDSEGVLYRNTEWYRIIGEDYLEIAFRAAHSADPGALLFYNDYNECMPSKRDKIYALIKGMLERDVPLHGLGLQAHWNIYSPSADIIRKAIEKYAELNIKLHVTEMDISVFRHEDGRTDIKEPDCETIDRLAEAYDRAFALFREYKDIITNVTTWGVADDSTWLDNFPVRGRKNWPLLFDAEHNPKKAYYSVTNF